MASSPSSHQRTFSESMFSQGVSPSDSFRTSQWNFVSGHGGFAGDFIFALPDPNASPTVKETFVDGNSSHKERLRWACASSPSDLGSQDCSDNYSTGIRPPAELLTCMLCSRWLSQRSATSSHRMLTGIDPPVVAVLSCGHVFHADCLEQSTSSLQPMQKQDPLCPQCSPPSGKAAAKYTALKELQSSSSSSSRGFLKSISYASTSSKNKLSRVGVINDDGPVPQIQAQPQEQQQQQLSRLPSSSGVKSQITSFFSDKGRLAKKGFVFKGRKDAVLGESKYRKPGSPARVSPEKDLIVEENKDSRCTSFRHP